MSHTPDTVDLTNRSTGVEPLRGERTVGQLVASASRDVSDLVRHEIALAKAELKKEAVAAGTGAAMFAVAALFGLVGFLFLCFTAAYAIIRFAHLSTWAGMGIVTLVLLVLAGIFALIGKNRISKVGPPERTINTSKDTVQALKGSR